MIIGISIIVYAAIILFLTGESLLFLLAILVGFALIGLVLMGISGPDENAGPPVVGIITIFTCYFLGTWLGSSWDTGGRNLPLIDTLYIALMPIIFLAILIYLEIKDDFYENRSKSD